MKFSQARKIKVGNPVWVLQPLESQLDPIVHMVEDVTTIKGDLHSPPVIIFKVTNGGKSRYVNHLRIGNPSLYGTPEFKVGGTAL